nr:hypothetical protein [Mucilaginibacter sp. X4EP1]MCS3812675.1 hypothetical protein [Mucilaginibacter sp. X4EP1]
MGKIQGNKRAASPPMNPVIKIVHSPKGSFIYMTAISGLAANRLCVFLIIVGECVGSVVSAVIDVNFISAVFIVSATLCGIEYILTVRKQKNANNRYGFFLRRGFIFIFMDDSKI